MHCFCLSQFININFEVMNIKFDDGQTYCKSWLEKYSLSNAFVYLVAAGIALINVIVKSILRCMSKFESAHTKTSELFSTTIKVFCI
jgi:hypothetical protein